MMTAAATDLPVPPDIVPERTLSAPEWGMASFLLSEVAFFSTLIVTYVTFLGKDRVGPTPGEALSLPLVIGTTACLVTSSVVIHAAERALERREQRIFCLFWAATIALGLLFLAGTAYEWRELIEKHHLTISRNMFGTTFYTLVGFHGLHVTAGIVALAVVLGLAMRNELNEQHSLGIRLVSWYWHFVDVVWIVVFLVVYVFGRGGSMG
jgi:cytochrome c oxidase subunit III